MKFHLLCGQNLPFVKWAEFRVTDNILNEITKMWLTNAETNWLLRHIQRAMSRHSETFIDKNWYRAYWKSS